ncbi:hypothetical protein V8F06_009638 [Rhypophila decipiens]
MADPISAITLAACALQFVDYGFKFVSKSIKIHQSATGGLDEQNELRTIVEALQARSEAIVNQTSSDDPGMAQILESCVAVSSELRDVLNSITRDVSSHSSKSFTNSAITAVRAMVKSNKIKELEACYNLTPG